MSKLKSPAESLTEIQRRNGVTVMVIEPAASYSTARSIPYAERYRQHTGLLATPVDELQRAAEDEAARKRRSAD